MRNAFYSLQPITKLVGAQIVGFDLAKQEFSDEFIRQIKQDVMKYRVLVFRELQTVLSGKRQVEFSSRLGKVESTFYKHPKSPDPDIFRVSNDSSEGCTNVGRSGWHVDGTFMLTPFVYQTMYFPSVCDGGSTHFVGLNELYKSVSPQTRERWNRLWLLTDRRSSPVHPLVYQHPHTDLTTMCFHCGPPFAKGWILEKDGLYDDVSNRSTGLDRVLELAQNQPKMSDFPSDDTVESVLPAAEIQDEITDAVNALMEHETAGFKMDWKAGDFAINDNLAMAHYADPDTQKSREEAGLRILHRTTVIGETPPRKSNGRQSFYLD